MEKMWFDFIRFFENENHPSPILISVLKKTNIENSNSDGDLYVLCDNLGTKILLERKKNEIEKSLSKFLKKELRLIFLIKEKKIKKTKDAPLLRFEIERQEAIKKSGLLEKYTFENYAVSSSNQLAHAAALAVSEKLGKIYNPLFIYGSVGVGKTHLAQAIANRVLENNLSKKVLFTSSESFVNDLVELIRSKNTLFFRKKYRSLDLLVIDDIQFIAGKNAVQEEFFHTFNAIIMNGGQIVITSDRPPQEIDRLEDRLRSRFSGGLVVDIQKPDLELKIAIILIKAKERGIEIDVEAAEIIAETTNDTRELEGKLLEFSAKAFRENTKITKEFVEKEINNKKSELVINKKIGPQTIIKTVCSFYGIKPSEIKNQNRKERVAFARQVVMYLLRNLINLKYEEIAFLLKKKDHTTIIHGVDKITRLLLKNPQIKEEISLITQNLK